MATTVMWLSQQPDSSRGTLAAQVGRGLESLEPRWLLSATLSAEFVWVDNTSQLSGYNTADLQVSSDVDWTGAALLLELTQGSIYQDSHGGNTEPFQFQIDQYPTLEFDTYVAANGHSATIVGGAGDVGGNGLRFDTVELDVSWVDFDRNDIGTINIGRITLSDDAVGTWSLRLINANNEVYTTRNHAFSNGRLTAPPPQPGQAVDGDFTGDGQPDIFWHSTRTGRNVVWELNGVDLVLETSVRRLRNTDWKLVGTGDFTGDGQNDLFWRNMQDGRNSVWEMDGTTFQNAIALNTLTNFKWQVAGVGDFTGDGQDDILWHNLQNGNNTVWEMNGTDLVGGIAIQKLKNKKWQAAGVGDFTGDGQDDVLWRNNKNGRNTVWEMNGTTFTGAVALKQVSNLDWQVAALADYTGDGSTDILWRNTRTGANTLWAMNDTEFLSGLSLPARTDLDDQPAGPILGLWEA